MAYMSQIVLPDGTTYDLKASIGSSLTLEEITLTNTGSQLGSVESYLSKDYFYVKSGSTPPAFEVDGRNNLNITANLPFKADGGISSTGFTASKILVSDANKNIVSSNLSESDLITTSNIGSQSVNYATSAGSATNATNATTLAGQDNNLTYSTPAQWGIWSGNGFRTAWYDTLNKISNQPSQWGFLLHVGRSYGEGHQIWATQSNGDLYHRGFNAGGTLSSLAFKKILDSSNYSSYALPLSGGTLTGSVNISGNYYYKVNNRVAVGDLGGSNFIACGNSGVYARRYDNPNNYVAMYASSFSQQSTKLVKDNIKSLTEDEASKLLDIDVVSFDYIKEVGGEKGQVGMIAEDILDIYPNLVQVPDDYDEEQAKENIKNGNNMGTLGLDYAKFTPYLIKMIQMQQKQINELKRRIEE